MKRPYLFDEFFSSGLEESVSPFLTPSSRRWARNLPLKSSLSAALFLACAFAFSFSSPPLSHLFLSLVYLIAGAPALLASLEDLKGLEINIDVLMTLAAFLAVAIGSGLEGALLLVLFELSHGMEDAVSHKARSALHNLNNLAPKFAHVVASDGTVFEKAVRDIAVEETLLIKQGEIAPLDGIVIEGDSSVNLVHLTGESAPQPKHPGDTVPAGARNLDAALALRVVRTSSDSTLTKIIQLITAAQEAKPKVQRFLDRFGKVYASAIIFLTCLFAAVLPLLFPLPYSGYEGSIYRSLAFLIAASPCALIIATPTAYLSAISACARRGILLKGGVTLDAIAACRAVAFDKTGTLTTGELQCEAIEPIGPTTHSVEEALGVAAALERHVVHPIAKAIFHLAAEKKVPLPPLQHFRAVPGHGVEAALSSSIPVAIGHAEYILNKIASPSSLPPRVEGELQTLLAIGNDLFAFRFRDRIREQASDLLHKLHQKRGLTSLILTGDNAINAAAVGRSLGIQTVFADLRPEDKLAKVAELSQTEGLAMVGDGINDAPALARATVGISMGRIGSATAVDASDVVLLNDDLHLLDWLFEKAEQTQQIVRQNLSLALAVIALATLPALGGLIPLWAAVLLHEGGTVLVGLNSLRLLR